MPDKPIPPIDPLFVLADLTEKALAVSDVVTDMDADVSNDILAATFDLVAGCRHLGIKPGQYQTPRLNKLLCDG